MAYRGKERCHRQHILFSSNQQSWNGKSCIYKLIIYVYLAECMLRFQKHPWWTFHTIALLNDITEHIYMTFVENKELTMKTCSNSILLQTKKAFPSS